VNPEAIRRDALQWFGVFGAPFAWAGQHVAGFALTLARCDRAGTIWGIPLDGVTIAISVVAATITVAAGAAAVYTLLQTRGVEKDDAPPLGRRHFLALVGVTIVPLFLAMILMSGSGVVSLPECRQS
jgi:hypothetical protein